MKPKVSVLIPAYNHGRYLNMTIDSVLNQTFTDFELLISDDCSTDNTAEIISGYSDKRIKAMFWEENIGTVASLNRLLKAAQGEYIAVLGSDDIWMPEKLERQLEILQNDPSIAACFSRVEIIDENSSILTQSNIFPVNIFDYENADKATILRDFFFSGNHLCHSTALIRADVHKEIGGYNLAYRQLHDFDLWVRILLKHNIYILDTKLAKYRFVQNSNNMSKDTEKNNLRLFSEAKEIMRYLFDNISDDDYIKGFSPYFVDKDAKSHTQIICEKFLLLQNYALWGAGCKILALDFLLQNLTEEVLDCFKTNYKLSLNSLYDYTGTFAANCHSEIYKELEAANAKCAELSDALHRIHSSKTWRILAFIKRIFTVFKGTKE